MDPPEEIIPQRVDPENKSPVVGETQSISAAMSKVLDDDNLLIEILLRIGFPTTLVLAAAVCRRWFQHASDRAFLRRFRELHPPRLLGFYVNPWVPRTTPRFVPMLPQPSEFASVIRRASSSLDSYQSDNASTYIRDCRNGNVLIKHQDRIKSTVGVHSLLRPDRGMATVPRFQHPRPQDGSFYTSQKILSKEEEGGGLSCLYLLMQSTPERKNMAHVYMLQAGVWCMHNLTIDQIPHTLLEPKSMLVDNKIYMPAAERDIVVLDLTASSFATIQLPKGVEYGPKNTMFSQADDAAAVYLVHVKELQVSVWLHNEDGWLLVDTICLLEICASLSMLDCNASPRLRHVGDNAEFVFLETRRCTLYLDVKCRTVRKVYEMTDMYQCYADIYPFMMIWPPTFPVLKDGPTRNAM